MTKKEVLKFSEEARRHGYITHDMLLRIYEDDEIVPDNVIRFLIYKPQKHNHYFVCGSNLYKLLNDL